MDTSCEMYRIDLDHVRGMYVATFHTAQKGHYDAPMHPGTVCVANAKGGVGKTSIVANVAGIAAVAGWRVLAVDLDPQGNLATDLGYQEHPVVDDGESLAASLMAGRPLPLISGVRIGLDVVPGGPQMTDALVSLAGNPDALSKVLAPVADDYDLVVIDCPPAGGPVVDAALAACTWLLVPVRADAASMDGLQLMARRFGPIRSSHNPHLRLLGVVLFDIARSSTAIQREVVAQLQVDLQGVAPILPGPIRRSERGAYDMRRLGLLAHEYEERHNAEVQIPLAERIQRAREGEQLARTSASAPGLASDYLALTNAVLDRVNELDV